MSIFTDADRTYLTEMRSITTNSQGQEILVGLTPQETEFYMEYAKRRMDGTHRPDDRDRDRYLELHDKHECARLSVLAAESQLRNDNPQRH